MILREDALREDLITAQTVYYICYRLHIVIGFLVLRHVMSTLTGVMFVFMYVVI